MEAREEESTGSYLPLNDSGNSERLIVAFGDRLRFAGGSWYAWDGKRWSQEHGAAIAMGFAKKTARLILAEAASIGNEQRRNETIKWARTSGNVPSMRHMLEAASTDPRIRCEVSAFDADPYLLNCPNGVVDLRNGELRDHDPGLLMTHITATNYVPGASDGILNTFLSDITCEDVELESYLQQAIGSALTGDVREDALFLLYGPQGRNGKSSLLEAVMAMMGDYAQMAPASMVVQGGRGTVPNDVARLVGRRFVAISETNANAQWDLGRLKMLTGGDTQVARFMRAEFFEFKPVCKLFIRTNHLPNVDGEDNAFWERARVIPFRASFTKESGTQDSGLRDRLKTDPHIQEALLAWGVQGAMAWLKAGKLVEPNAVKDAVQEYREAQDPLAQWLAECTSRVHLVSEAVGVTAAHNSYTEWARSAGEKPLGRKMWLEAMAARGYAKGKREHGGGMCIRGLRLLSYQERHTA